MTRRMYRIMGIRMTTNAICFPVEPDPLPTSPLQVEEAFAARFPPHEKGEDTCLREAGASLRRRQGEGILRSSNDMRIPV